jgi:SAM-dependent methyltransferase
VGVTSTRTSFRLAVSPPRSAPERRELHLVDTVLPIDLLAPAGTTRVGHRVEPGGRLALPFPDGAFDDVRCRVPVGTFGDPRQVVVELLRVVRPGGVVLVEEDGGRIALVVR